MNIKIGKASLEEARTLDYFLTKLIQDEKQYDDNIDGSFVVNSYYEYIIPNENNCVLIAKIEDVLVGFLYGYIENSGDCYIDKKAILDAMYVDSDYRKKVLEKPL